MNSNAMVNGIIAIFNKIGQLLLLELIWAFSRRPFFTIFNYTLKAECNPKLLLFEQLSRIYIESEAIARILH